MSSNVPQVASSPSVEVAWAATGALTVVLFACGLLFGDLLGTTNYPALNASSSQLRRHFLHNVSEVRALSLFHLLAAAALAAFASHLYSRLRPAGARLAALALGGGVIGAAFPALQRSSTGCSPSARWPPTRGWLTAWSCSPTSRGPAIGVALALTAAAFAAAIRRERLLPVWLWWVSTVTAVLGLATVTTPLAPADNSSAAYGVLLLGALAGFAWLVATSVVPVGRTLRAE